MAGTTGTGAADPSPFRVNPQLLKRSRMARKGGVHLIGICPQKCLGAQNTAVPGTGSPWGRASLVTRHWRMETRAHLDRAAQRHRMLSPCLFTAPAWNSNGTPRQRLAGTNVALGTVLDSFSETRQARRHSHPSVQPWGTPPTPPQAQAGLDKPGCAEPQSRPARSLGPALAARSLPLVAPGARRRRGCCHSPATPARWKGSARVRPPRHRPPGPPRRPPRAGIWPLTGSVLSAVSGVRGGAAGQVPAGWCGGAGGGGCLSRAGCVSSASCRSRIDRKSVV